MLTSESLDQIAPDWVAALSELKDIARSEVANAGTYSYRYATLATAAQQARDVLSKHHLAVHQSAHASATGSISVTTRAWHVSGQWIEAEPLVMPSKGGPQDVGSAISYARRYSLMSFLGLATDDDDGAGAQAAHREPPIHPLSERVKAAVAGMKALDDAGKQDLKDYAQGTSLAPSYLLDHEAWLESVEFWLSERSDPT